MTDRSRFLPDRLYADPETTRKRITVHFEATPSDALPWTFSPVTRSVKVLPGETALAFYTAKNNSDKDLIGIATYNMTPEKVCPIFQFTDVTAALKRSGLMLDRTLFCQGRMLLL
jgi:cytochrome c oxidase assembly protein subunit 11